MTGTSHDLERNGFQSAQRRPALAMSVAALVLAGCSSRVHSEAIPRLPDQPRGWVVPQWARRCRRICPQPISVAGSWRCQYRAGLIDRTTASPVGTQSAVVSQDLPAFAAVVSNEYPSHACTNSRSILSVVIPSQPHNRVRRSSVWCRAIPTSTPSLRVNRSTRSPPLRCERDGHNRREQHHLTRQDRRRAESCHSGRPDLLAQRGQTQQVAAVSGSQTLATPSSTPANSQTATPAPAAQPAA